MPNFLIGFHFRADYLVWAQTLWFALLNRAYGCVSWNWEPLMILFHPLNMEQSLVCIFKRVQLPSMGCSRHSFYVPDASKLLLNVSKTPQKVDFVFSLCYAALIESDAEGIGGSGFVECIREHIHSVGGSKMHLLLCFCKLHLSYILLFDSGVGLSIVWGAVHCRERIGNTSDIWITWNYLMAILIFSFSFLNWLSYVLVLVSFGPLDYLNHLHFSEYSWIQKRDFLIVKDVCFRFHEIYIPWLSNTSKLLGRNKTV